jgi:hypothetical protein
LFSTAICTYIITAIITKKDHIGSYRICFRIFVENKVVGTICFELGIPIFGNFLRKFPSKIYIFGFKNFILEGTRNVFIPSKRHWVIFRTGIFLL